MPIPKKPPAGATDISTLAFSHSRRTWRSIMADAHNSFAVNTAACKNHDQSALNAVAHDRRVRLSLQWNFQTLSAFSGSRTA
jgi:hypothetical protein